MNPPEFLFIALQVFQNLVLEQDTQLPHRNGAVIVNSSFILAV